MVMKEEGQVLVHSANCWGEKTMASTGAEGLESIRQELSQLQMDWDLFLCNVRLIFYIVQFVCFFCVIICALIFMLFVIYCAWIMYFALPITVR